MRLLNDWERSKTCAIDCKEMLHSIRINNTEDMHRFAKNYKIKFHKGKSSQSTDKTTITGIERPIARKIHTPYILNHRQRKHHIFCNLQL